MARGVPSIATHVGGVPRLLPPDRVVPPGDVDALADALVLVLSDRALAERLAAGARVAAAPWVQSPEEYARRMRELVA
jgi:glycosyltransferase involved in cell wall biosynthesis